MSPTNKSKLIAIFEELYPAPSSELNFKDEFQLIICVVLSAQCTDKKVNEVTPKLFSKFPTFKELSQAKGAEVEAIIRQVNYYRTKSKNIINLSKMVCDEFGGKIPHSFEEITSLPGVGRKTASVVLGEMKVEHTLAVDTHVFRVSQRLGLAKGKTPEEIEEQLKKQFKPELWRNLHHWLILHGRRVCKAQSPNCADCKLSGVCPSSSV